ncbi:MAG: inositol monophosphatase [Candidatus Altiarchaeota archaeon]|nr:inositol monophosphatase [Candidatus Altiarchaeota archaeon]
MDGSDLSKELDVAVAAARDAGGILMERYGKVSARFKSDHSIVTDADMESEKRIRGILGRDFPAYSFLGEESGMDRKDSEFTWVVDPLDGTTNYSIRNPFFNVSIALAKDQVPVLGVVYYPFQDELFHAVRGAGAFLNGERIHVSWIREMGDAMACFCHGHDAKTVERMAVYFRNFKLATDRFRQIGAAALELSYLACGRIDSFFMLKMNPWDVAAGSLLVSEAGGKVSDAEGNAFTLDSRDLVASNLLLHDQVLGLLKP